MADPEEEAVFREKLIEWLKQLRLEPYADKATAWCKTMGAVQIEEVLENLQEFASAMALKPLEKKRIDRYADKRKDGAAAEAQPPETSQHPARSSQPPTPASPLPPPTGSSGRGNFIGTAEKRYAILEELGSGATATVYKCTRGEEVFAVKSIILTKLRLQRDFKLIADKLHREVQILFSFEHPKIVRLFDVVEEPDKLHLVMELVDGGELFDQIVRRGAFSESQARNVFVQIAEALQYIHSKDIVYRDLKPENILVDARNSSDEFIQVKLSDFGHSKLINDGYSTALTKVGTPQYWAPEVAQGDGRGYDQRVDLWSLGVVLYVMLVGSYPFDGVGERMEDQIRKAHLSFHDKSDRISAEAKEVIKALIKVRPQDRMTLENCLTHAWVGEDKDRAISSERRTRSDEDTEVVPLPQPPTKVQVEEIRRDLNEWMKRHKCSAVVKNDKVIGQLGRASREDVEPARDELRAIVRHHFRGISSAPFAPSARTSVPRGPPGGALEPILEKKEARTYRDLFPTLRVHQEIGAGLDLEPEKAGMRVTSVLEHPGQPGLMPNDLITKINEVSLRASTPARVEAIFGAHFCDGAQLQIRRFR